MHSLIRRFVSFSLLAALSGACVEKEGETTEDTTGGSSGDSTGGTSGDSTGDETGATEDASGSESATGEPTTGEPTTGEPTTGEPGALCGAYVEWSVMCGLAEPGSEVELLAECEMQRDINDAVTGPACAAKSDAYLECLTASACPGDDFPCQVEFEAASDCGPEAGATCKAFAKTAFACEPDEGEAEIAESCQIEINVGGFEDPACGAAMEALYGCYAGLDCTQFDDETSCAAESVMVEASCPGEDFGPVHPGGVEFETHRR